MQQQLRPWRNAKQASEYLAEKGYKVAAGTLNKYRTLGGGPRYRKFGRVPLYGSPLATIDNRRWEEMKSLAPRLKPFDSRRVGPPAKLPDPF
jgi:hypothetical protein